MQKMMYRLLSLLLALFFLCTPVVASADNIFGDQIPEDQQKIFNNGIGYFDAKDGNCTAGGSTPTGTLPAIIPEPYNGAFTKAGNTFKVSPALIAALFTEENFTHEPVSGLAARWAAFPAKHPDPNSGWATNQFQTMGAFQFIPGTWAAYGADGNGDGVKDAQNLMDGAAGAANYVAHNGATIDKPPASWQNAIFAYNHAQWYVDAVMMYYNFYNTGATNTAPPTTTAPPAATQVSDSCSTTGTANVNCNQGASSNTGVGAKAVCLARAELALWKAGQLKPGTDFFKYSYNADTDWCAYFVSWIYKQAGLPLTAGNGAVGLVGEVKGIGQQGGSFTFYPASTYTPKPGDLAIHDIGSAHVNIVSEVSGNTIKMIGGNQSTNNYHTSNVSEYSENDYHASDISGFVSPTGQPI